MPTSGTDSYAPTAFAPVMPPPSPAEVQIRRPPDPTAIGSGPTMLSAQPQNAPPPQAQPVVQHPPTIRSNQPAPQYVVRPTPSNPPPTPYNNNPVYPQYSPPGGYPLMQNPATMPSGSTPGLAIAGLICGIFGLTPFWIGFVLCILAIIFASIILSQTRSGDPGRGMAIAALILGLVFILPAACGL